MHVHLAFIYLELNLKCITRPDNGKPASWSRERITNSVATNCDHLLEEYMLRKNIGSLELGKTPNGIVVRHIPYNMAPVISSFLARDCNKGSVKII